MDKKLAIGTAVGAPGDEAVKGAWRLLAAHIGSGRAGICNDVVLATRMSKKGGTPFLRRSNGLTKKFTLIEKEAS